MIADGTWGIRIGVCWYGWLGELHLVSDPKEAARWNRYGPAAVECATLRKLWEDTGGKGVAWPVVERLPLQEAQG